MDRKQKFAELWEWECMTTIKVLKAMPEGKDNIKPNETGRTAKDILDVLAREQESFGRLAKAEGDMSEFNKPVSSTWNEAVALFEKNHEEAKQIISELTEQDFENKIVKLPWRETTIDDALMTFMHDMIHHRGQLTIYLRLADGKVPSIYGPSGDDPGPK